MAELFSSAVGVLGVLAGGVGVAAVNFRSERRKDYALEQQQLREQAAQDRAQRREQDLEHQKWLREHRQTAYVALLDAADEAREAAWVLLRKVREPSTNLEELDQASGLERAAAGVLLKHLHAVQIVGPAPVAEASLTFVNETLDRRNAVAVVSRRRRDAGMAPLTAQEAETLQAEHNEHMAHIVEAEMRFAALARTALASLNREG